MNEQPTGRDPRRLGLGAAAIIAGYALVVAAISSAAGAGDLGPPETVPRPIFLAVLLMVPAGIAFIGATRRSRPPLVAAGLLCLVQSFIAFSGVTLPFVVPAFLLLGLGAQGSGVRSPRRTVLGGALAVVLGIAMLVAPFALTETTCWVARRGADGTTDYTRTPVSDTGTLGPTDVAAGCDGGTLTLQGTGLALVFGIGALAVAALATARSAPKPTSEASA